MDMGQLERYIKASYDATLDIKSGDIVVLPTGEKIDVLSVKDDLALGKLYSVQVQGSPGVMSWDNEFMGAVLMPKGNIVRCSNRS
jgi:hypothetical protein